MTDGRRAGPLFLSEKFLREDGSAGVGDLMQLAGALVFSLYTVHVG